MPVTVTNYIDLLQGIAHECCPVAIGQAVRDAERLNARERGLMAAYRRAHKIWEPSLS